jgi:radical SAM superfamily enzyme YgiQ (UPF0313 family)
MFNILHQNGSRPDQSPQGGFTGFKVGLVHPYLKEAKVKNRLKFRESLALGYLTAALERAACEVVTVNAELRSLGPEEVSDILLADSNLGLVGISAKSQRTYSAAKQIARLIKERRPDIHVTIGGVFPTAADAQVLGDSADIDSVVRGEGEEAIVDLARRVAAGADPRDMAGLTFRKDGAIGRTPNRPRVENLDSLAFPARRDLEYILRTGAEPLASAYLVASRGCYAACTFCSIHQIYGDHQVKRRSPESIAAEMEQVSRQFGVTRFSFVDDLFVTPSPAGIRWVHDFCRVIQERGLDVNFYAEMRADTVDLELLGKLRRAGLHRLFIGMEAGCDSVLKRWDKGTTVADNDRALDIIRKAEMPPHAVNFGYIMFDPEMTFAELKQQYGWLRGTGYCSVQHLQNKMNIYWGTPHYERMLSQGRVDTAEFGQRWSYEFDDARVGAIEAAFRRFHARFQEECEEEYLDAAESFRFALKVHPDRAETRLPNFLVDLLSQAQRCCDQTLRAVYYFVFDALIEAAERGQLNSAGSEERIWSELEPLIAQLRRESRYLLAFTREVAKLKILGSGDAPRPGTAWVEEGGRRALVWLNDLGGECGYRATIGARGDDRYDHACELVRFGSPSGEAIGLPALREAVYNGTPTLVDMEMTASGRHNVAVTMQ